MSSPLPVTTTGAAPLFRAALSVTIDGTDGSRETSGFAGAARTAEGLAGRLAGLLKWRGHELEQVHIRPSQDGADRVKLTLIATGPEHRLAALEHQVTRLAEGPGPVRSVAQIDRRPVYV